MQKGLSTELLDHSSVVCHQDCPPMALLGHQGSRCSSLQKELKKSHQHWFTCMNKKAEPQELSIGLF